ncbi:hypothetical protein L6452_03471 [Arctium lappa]|uniref:Uncharacterized protein n=1 Tax=Arctium lappa TaxID=4217 RepID=A0ACB9FLZ2_ARCLA|nr:hypothetical protein L6452_03471 [Arctium lappa]
MKTGRAATAKKATTARKAAPAREAVVHLLLTVGRFRPQDSSVHHHPIFRNFLHSDSSTFLLSSRSLRYGL